MGGYPILIAQRAERNSVVALVAGSRRMNSLLQTLKTLQRHTDALQAEAGREMVRLAAQRLVEALEVASTLSLPAVAQLLGINRVTVWKWVQRGRVPAVRVGHRYRVPQSIVETMLHPVDVALDPGGEWRCPAPGCRAAFGSAAALAAHLVTAHFKEAGK